MQPKQLVLGLSLLFGLVLPLNPHQFFGQPPIAGQTNNLGFNAFNGHPVPPLPHQHPRQFGQKFSNQLAIQNRNVPQAQTFFGSPNKFGHNPSTGFFSGFNSKSSFGQAFQSSSITPQHMHGGSSGQSGFFSAPTSSTARSSSSSNNNNPFFNPKSPQNNHNHVHKDPFVFDEAVSNASNVKLQPLPGPAHPISNPSFSSLPAFGKNANLCPQGIRVRKEFRDLTWDEWSRYLAAVKKMYIPDSTGRSKADRFTRIHLDNASVAHNTAHFLPWHRWFTYLYEEELRKFDADVTIPYWDWTFDAQAPLKSPLFRPEYLGLKTGKAGDCNWIVSYPKRHCVVRNYHHKSFGTLYGRRTIDRLITDTRMSWAEFAELFESSPHGIVHYKVGGPGGDLADMASPNDPLFFLHHSMVDYIWVQRQEFTGRAMAFGGKHRGRKANSGDELRPFRVTVEETFDYGRLCYTYQPFSGWHHAAPAALRAGANVDGDEVEGQHKLPDPLPDEWIKMHGWPREWVEEREKKLREMESTPLTTDFKAKKAFMEWFSRDTLNQIGNARIFGPIMLIAIGAIVAVALVIYL